MGLPRLLTGIICILLAFGANPANSEPESDSDAAATELHKALELIPDPGRGRPVNFFPTEGSYVGSVT